eukprot:scaffold99793_cov58-Phaeocystis_antarctica.AAC.1
MSPARKRERAAHHTSPEQYIHHGEGAAGDGRLGDCGAEAYGHARIDRIEEGLRGRPLVVQRVEECAASDPQHDDAAAARVPGSIIRRCRSSSRTSPVAARAALASAAARGAAAAHDDRCRARALRGAPCPAPLLPAPGAARDDGSVAAEARGEPAAAEAVRGARSPARRRRGRSSPTSSWPVAESAREAGARLERETDEQ